jgi:hypothetical protein
VRSVKAAAAVLVFAAVLVAGPMASAKPPSGKPCASPTNIATSAEQVGVQIPTKRGSVWALAFGRVPPPVGTFKIVWRVTGSGPFRAGVTDPTGKSEEPYRGPTRHLSSSFDRPGDEYGTVFKLDAPGCWKIRVSRGGVEATVRVTVVSAAPTPPDAVGTSH